MYKLISFDMDGTLLNDDKLIDPETVRQIEKAADQGKVVALCTGRGVAELVDYGESLCRVRYAICTSGGLIWDIQKKEKIYSKNLDPETCLRIFDLMEGRNCIRQILGVENYLSAADIMHLEPFQLEAFRPSYLRSATILEDTEKFYRENQFPIEKLNFHFTSTAERDEVCKKIADAGLPVEVIGTGMGTLEINAAGVNKGETLKCLCQSLAIDTSEVIAVGDSYNDIPMLQAAGLPIAMANANATVKSMCKVMVADNNHGGCAEAIEKYLLEKEN